MPKFLHLFILCDTAVHIDITPDSLQSFNHIPTMFATVCSFEQWQLCSQETVWSEVSPLYVSAGKFWAIQLNMTSCWNTFALEKIVSSVEKGRKTERKHSMLPTKATAEICHCTQKSFTWSVIVFNFWPAGDLWPWKKNSNPDSNIGLCRRWLGLQYFITSVCPLVAPAQSFLGMWYIRKIK